MRPGFESRTGNYFLPLFCFWGASDGCKAGGTTVVSRLAQLVERKTLNLVVVGSSPTVGAFIFLFRKKYFVADKKVI